MATRRRSVLLVARRLTQALVLAGFVVMLWTTKYPLEGFVNPKIFFNLDPLVMLVTAVAERLWLPGTLLALLVLAFTLVFGRLFCGWFCPLGTLQDYVGPLARRVNPRPETGPHPSRHVKYAVLALIVILGVSGVQFVWLLDPFAVLVRAFSFNVFPAVNVAADRSFAFLLQSTSDYPPLEAIYHALREQVLDIRTPVFPYAGLTGLFILLPLGLVFWRRRTWCRVICPLGALLGVAAMWPLWRRVTRACGPACSVCRQRCRTGAIRPDNSYAPEECIMCFDCTVLCPAGSATFTFSRPKRPVPAISPDASGLSRAEFIGLMAGTLAASAVAGCTPAKTGAPLRRAVIRPPGALPEPEFIQRCIRCGNCMKVCITNGLQPALLESGPAGIWTPRLVPRIGYCEYQCNLCGQVCPTGALPALTLEEKRRARLGVARVRTNRCIPWAYGGECLVCEEHCPIPEKAIKVKTVIRHGKVSRCPVVDEALCVGCAICETQCPVNPHRAIEVEPLSSEASEK